MYRILKIICAFIIITCPAIAQNEIDHIATLWPSGYGKLAIDGDTLYVNTINGHGVERYDISNPANPIFIDREEVSGFDQIDFNRRIMAKANSGQLYLSNFSDFESTSVVSNISLLGMRNWKLLGNYVYDMLESDSLRIISIADPVDPVNINTTYLSEIGGYPSSVIFGSTIVMIQRGTGNRDSVYVYRINEQNDIHLIHFEVLLQPTLGGVGFDGAKGDTMALIEIGPVGYWWSINFVSYAINDTSRFPSWGEYYNGHPRMLYSNDNSFILAASYFGVIAYKFTNFNLLGIGPDLFPRGVPAYNFDCTLNGNFIAAWPETLYFYEPTHDSTSMPVMATASSAHCGILSSASYGNYLLSGAESNGGELLIHQLDQSGQLNLFSVAPNVKAKKIAIVGSSAICLCPSKFSQVSLLNPSEPVISHELNGFSGELLSFSYHDSLIYAITDRAYYVIDYDSLSGMTILSQMSFPANSLTSLGQYNTASVLLQGSLAHLIKISAANPTLPVIIQEKQLRPDTFQYEKVMYATIWAFGRHGTDVLNIYTMDSTAFYGPEYFSDVHQISVVPDTLFIADGVNGIKIFSFQDYPYGQLHFIGGYGTGNVVNQLATIGNNIFASDYYSLQHLRWGAHTGIGNSDSPNQPRDFTLMQNYPNPFNASTTIQFDLPSNTKSALSVFDITGRQIRHFDISGDQHEIIWDGLNQSGLSVASGIYFYTIENQYRNAKKMVLLR